MASCIIGVSMKDVKLLLLIGLLQLVVSKL